MSAAALPTWLVQVEKKLLGDAYSQKHWQRFLKHGFPQRCDERWKYADLSSWHDLNLTPIANTPATEWESPIAQTVAQFKAQYPQHLFFVFIDGRYIGHYSDQDQLPQTIIVGRIKNPSIKNLIAGQGFDLPDHTPFADLNAALSEDGLYLALPNDCVLTQPIQILSLTTQAKNIIQPRHLLVLGQGSRLSLVENVQSLISTQAYFVNSLMQIKLGEQASLNYCKLQRESNKAIHLAHLFVNQARDSEFALTQFSFGGCFARDEVLVRMEGPGASCKTAGFYQPQQSGQYIDQHIDVEHLAPQSNSEMFYKGIIGKGATAVFNGRVYVAKAAQKTVSYQGNQHLLLSKQANAFAKPELEINADDVKCKHGAATGQLDDEVLFYLRSRGLSIEVAKRMLLAGFAEEVVQRAPIAMQKSIQEFINQGEA